MSLMLEVVSTSIVKSDVSRARSCLYISNMKPDVSRPCVHVDNMKYYLL